MDYFQFIKDFLTPKKERPEIIALKVRSGAAFSDKTLITLKNVGQRTAFHVQLKKYIQKIDFITLEYQFKILDVLEVGQEKEVDYTIYVKEKDGEWQSSDSAAIYSGVFDPKYSHLENTDLNIGYEDSFSNRYDTDFSTGRKGLTTIGIYEIGEMFSKKTSILVKVPFLLFLIHMVLAFAVNKYGHAKFIEPNLIFYLQLTPSLAICLSILFRQYFASVTFFILLIPFNIYLKYVDIINGSAISYLWITGGQISPHLVVLIIWIYFIHIFLLSGKVKKYYGVDCKKELEKNEWELVKENPKTYKSVSYISALLVCISLFFQLGFGGGKEKADENGLKIVGNLKINVLQVENGGIKFDWPGLPVSYIDVREGRYDEWSGKKPIWKAVAKLNKENCLPSPATYDFLDDTCAKSTPLTELDKGKEYTVFIARSYDQVGRSHPALGWALREFRVR